MGNPYGRLVVLPLTNQSGGAVAAGDVVIVDTAHNDSFTTTTTGAYTGAIGIAQQAIANGALGLVLVEGYASLVNVNASVTRGNFGKTHTVVKQATDAGASRVAGTFCMFLTGGTTPDAIIWQPDLGAGSGMTNPMSAKGDIIIGDTGGTPSTLAAGATAGMVLRSAGSGAFETWALPPGYEFDYAGETTGTTSITATTEATADTIVTGNAVTYDGSTIVLIEFQAFGASTGTTVITFCLYDGSSSIGKIAILGGTTGYVSIHGAYRITPSNAAHTYSIRAYVDGGNGAVYAGAGGVGTYTPTFIRITKAA